MKRSLAGWGCSVLPAWPSACMTPLTSSPWRRQAERGRTGPLQRLPAAHRPHQRVCWGLHLRLDLFQGRPAGQHGLHCRWAGGGGMPCGRVVLGVLGAGMGRQAVQCCRPGPAVGPACLQEHPGCTLRLRLAWLPAPPPPLLLGLTPNPCCHRPAVLATLAAPLQLFFINRIAGMAPSAMLHGRQEPGAGWAPLPTWRSFVENARLKWVGWGVRQRWGCRVGALLNQWLFLRVASSGRQR